MATIQHAGLQDDRRRALEPGRGRTAGSPTDIPGDGWKDVALRVKQAIKDDNVSLMAAGVAFYSLIALVPAMAAIVSFYGLVSSPSEVQRQVGDILSAAPADARQLVEEQLTSIVQSGNAGLGIGLVVGLAVALWSAASGMQHLVEAVNAAYGERDTRGFLKTKALALSLTIGAVVFVVAAFLLVAVLPSALADTALGDAARITFSLLRWPLLFAGLVIGLGVVYRAAPDRDDAEVRWVTPGAVVASVLFVLGSIAFSIYASSFGSYNETYGSLGAIVVLLLWLFLLSFVVILGAELNAELEHQTARDTTTGPDRPLGDRDAAMADQVGPSATALRGGSDMSTTDQDPRGSGETGRAVSGIDLRERSAAAADALAARRAAAADEGDLAAKAADAVEGVVETVRAKTAEPVLATIGKVVIGTVLAFVGIGAVVLLYALALRALVIVLPGEVWVAHLVLAVVFAGAGVALLLTSRAKAPTTAHDLAEQEVPA